MVQYLSSLADYIAIYNAFRSGDTEAFLTAKELFETSFNVISSSAAHIPINLVSTHITNTGFYLHIYPSTVYKCYTQEIFIEAIRVCSNDIDRPRLGAPIGNHLYFKKKFVSYMENKPYTIKDALTIL